MENFVRLTINLTTGDPQKTGDNIDLLDEFVNLLGGKRAFPATSSEVGVILMYDIPKEKEKFGILMMDMKVTLNNYIRG
jgi:hypothetical protein